jgi:hypothetical protein
MNRLSESSGETVSLGIKMGLKNINIHVVTSTSDLKVDGAKLRIRPIQMGVDGLVLLSQLDDKQITNIINTIQSDSKNKTTKTAAADLFNKIKQIRSLGFAIGHSELTFGAAQKLRAAGSTESGRTGNSHETQDSIFNSRVDNDGWKNLQCAGDPQHTQSTSLSHKYDYHLV